MRRWCCCKLVPSELDDQAQGVLEVLGILTRSVSEDELGFDVSSRFVLAHVRVGS